MTTVVDKQTKRRHHARAPLRAARHQLILISDDVDTEHAIRIALEENFAVVRLAPGQKNISESRLREVDIILLDWTPIGQSDLQSLVAIRKLNAEAEIIVISSNPSAESILQAFRMGTNDFIVKPIDLQSLRKSTAMALNRRRQTLARRRIEQRAVDRGLHEDLAEATNQICFGILHDLKSTLAGISLTSGFIYSKMNSCSSLEGLLLQETKDEISDLARYANYCVDISKRMERLYPTESYPAPEPARVDQIIQDAVFLAKRLPAGQKHQMVTRVQPLTATTRIRESDLFQLVVNLIINALQSSECPHEVTVEASRVDRPLKHDGELSPYELALYSSAFTNEPPFISISVRDNGDGMSCGHLRRAFDFRFTTKSRSHGTGLGLAIVRQLVEACHGALHVCSRVGQGTEITVYFNTADAGGADGPPTR